MHLARAAFLAAAFGLSAACASADPAPQPAGEPEAVPVKPIRVGGPCAYETTEFIATVIEVAGSNVQLAEEGDRDFGLGAASFSAPPEPGETYWVSKRKITTGTCVPVIYTLIRPATDKSPAPDAAN